jgi:hypothetical protein
MSEDVVTAVRANTMVMDLMSSINCVSSEVKFLAEELYGMLNLGKRRSNKTKLAVYYCVMMAQRQHIPDENYRVSDLLIGQELGLDCDAMSKATTMYNGYLKNDVSMRVVTSSSPLPLIIAFFTANGFNEDRLNAIRIHWATIQHLFVEHDINTTAAAYVYIYILQMGCTIEKTILTTYYFISLRNFELMLAEALRLLN